MTTKSQRPRRASAKAVEGESHYPDPTRSGPAGKDAAEASDRPVEAPETTPGTIAPAESLAEVVAALLALCTVLDRQAEPPIERLAFRFDELAASIGVSRRVLERERAAGRLPKPDLYIGRMPLYRPETIRAWLDPRGKGVT
jgi:hypothetical protein